MYDPNLYLEFHEQEERRRTFWSIYILDAFATCGRARPPIFQSAFCKLGLPSSESAFRENRYEHTPRLDDVLKATGSSLTALSPFARVIVIATVLRDCAQHVIQDVNIRDEKPPWDVSSDFSAVNSVLLDLEGRMEISKPIKEAIREYMVQEPADRVSVEHVVFSYVLFHLAQCLLNHHFLLRHRLQPYAGSIPSRFLYQTSEACNVSAQQLTLVLDEAGSFGCKLHISFYGYGVMVAGTLNALSQYSDNPAVSQRAKLCLGIDVAFLQKHSQFWNNSTTMVTSPFSSMGVLLAY